MEDGCLDVEEAKFCKGVQQVLVMLKGFGDPSMQQLQIRFKRPVRLFQLLCMRPWPACKMKSRWSA